jgi:quinol monooxygenase YgiN
MFSRTAAALILAASLSLPLFSERASADAIPGQFVLVVELEIDPAQLEPFKAAIKENGETAVRVEPGCRSFSAVFEKDNPTLVRLFEIYENAARSRRIWKRRTSRSCRDHEGHGQVAQANR